MEIFQKIWTALTTPNEILTNLLSIPLAFLDAYVCMLLFTTILNIPSTHKQRLIYVLAFGVFTNLINLTISNSFAVLLLSVIIWPVLVFYIFKISILKSILSEIIPYILSLCLELFITKLFYVAFKITSETIVKVPILRCSLALLIYGIIFVVSIIIKHYKLNLKVFEGISPKAQKILIINAILLVFVIISQFYLIVFYNNTLPIYITLISIIGLLAYFALSIYSILNISKLEITSRDLKQSQLYNNMIFII